MILSRFLERTLQAEQFALLVQLFQILARTVASPTFRSTIRASADQEGKMNSRFLQISEVSDLLDISKTTTRRLVKNGVLPAIRMGRQIRIDERRFQEWLEQGGGGT